MIGSIKIPHPLYFFSKLGILYFLKLLQVYCQDSTPNLPRRSSNRITLRSINSRFLASSVLAYRFTLSSRACSVMVCKSDIDRPFSLMYWQQDECLRPAYKDMFSPTRLQASFHSLLIIECVYRLPFWRLEGLVNK